MATLASLAPADGAQVEQDQPIAANITNATDLTPSLIEIKVNGQSFTVANGGLVLWNIRKLSAGSLVYDYTDVWIRTVGAWPHRPWSSIAVDVIYDSSSLGTASYPRRPWDGEGRAPVANWLQVGWTTDVPDLIAGHWTLESDSPLSGYGIAHYMIRDEEFYSQDGYYFVAHWIRQSDLASITVGLPMAQRVQSSLTVRGLVRLGALASTIVQGTVRAKTDGSVIVGIVFRAGALSTTIVGVPVLRVLPASVVVYAVQRGPILEILVNDQSTLDALAELGITFS